MQSHINIFYRTCVDWLADKLTDWHPDWQTRITQKTRHMSYFHRDPMLGIVTLHLSGKPEGKIHIKTKHFVLCKPITAEVFCCSFITHVLEIGFHKVWKSELARQLRAIDPSVLCKFSPGESNLIHRFAHCCIKRLIMASTMFALVGIK